MWNLGVGVRVRVKGRRVRGLWLRGVRGGFDGRGKEEVMAWELNCVLG